MLATETKPTPVKQLLRFSTAGSVDDGKSTLIGRLLYDSRGLYQDQIAKLNSESRQDEPPNWALLTDGLKAEREQGITIDVAYRYFSTQARKFIIADTPGHEQYTRNMATGASTADLTIVLVDARKGVRTQSRRHAFIAALMGIPNVVVAVNKMDLVGFQADVFEKLSQELGSFLRQLGLTQVSVVPISALLGDNVVHRSRATSWYEGPTLLELLEQTSVSRETRARAFRFPVQHVLRPHQDFRGYAGRIASGVVRVGDAVMVLPSRQITYIDQIQLYQDQLLEAQADMSVTLKLTEEVDLGRGDMLVHAKSLPTSAQQFEAMVVWFNEDPLQRGRTYLLKQTTQTVRATVDQISYCQNVDNLAQEPTTTLNLNQIGRVSIQTFQDLHFDAYADNRTTGSFILIDPVENHTLGAGMILGQAAPEPFEQTHQHPKRVAPEERAQRLGHKQLCIWLTGAKPADREALASHLERLLFDQGMAVVKVNSSRVLPGIPPSQARLGFGALLRVVSLFLDTGQVVIAWQDQADDHLRAGAAEKIPPEHFFEVHLSDQPHPHVQPASNLPWPSRFVGVEPALAAQVIWQNLIVNPLFP